MWVKILKCRISLNKWVIQVSKTLEIYFLQLTVFSHSILILSFVRNERKLRGIKKQQCPRAETKHCYYNTWTYWFLFLMMLIYSSAKYVSQLKTRSENSPIYLNARRMLECNTVFWEGWLLKLSFQLSKKQGTAVAMS